MDKATLWSLRLGYSANQATTITSLGIQAYLSQCFQASYNQSLPDFLKDDPKTLLEIRDFRLKLNRLSAEEKKQIVIDGIRKTARLKVWWIDKIKADDNPLREKMVCFWHNHFVSSAKKVKLTYWVYEHHMLLQQAAFGNFKQLCKTMIKSNAMLRYLDNVDNKKGELNENLSRELLELFTLGIGNYTEDDVKNGAKALAGLGYGNGLGAYRKRFSVNEKITYLGEVGYFKADDLIDIIFRQPQVSDLITKKLIQWFLYDNPSPELVSYYADYFRTVDFEIQPFLIKLFSEEYLKPQLGLKIKDPLCFALQLMHELGLTHIDSAKIRLFLKQQGMDLFDPPNVKGWKGGRAWLSTQTYAERNHTVDRLIQGALTLAGSPNRMRKSTFKDKIPEESRARIRVKNKTQAKIIAELSNRLLFETSTTIQEDMHNILKYDFDWEDENASQGLLRLFAYIAKTPAFQLV